MKRTEPQANLVLIGLMGSGKTSVGRRLAKATNRRFVDVDVEIQRSAGMPIARIFEDQGEDAFRALETDALGHIEPQRSLVISCGGGIVVTELNRRLLKELGIVIWLQADSATLAERVARSKNRPLLAGTDPLEVLRRLAAERASWYAEVAHVTIDTTGLDHDHVAAAILNSIDNTFGEASINQPAGCCHPAPPRA